VNLFKKILFNFNQQNKVKAKSICITCNYIFDCWPNPYIHTQKRISKNGVYNCNQYENFLGVKQEGQND